MKQTFKPLGVMVSGLLLAGTTATALGDTAPNPFRPISDRNAFGLKPYTPVPQPPPPQQTNAPVEIKLAGISKVNNVKRVYLVLPEPGKPGQVQYLDLTDDKNSGQTAKNGIEVLAIDEAKETVKILNGASELVLNFKDNGVKAAGTVPLPMAPPGSPPMHTAPGMTTGIPTPQGGGSAPIVVSSRSANPANNGMPATGLNGSGPPANSRVIISGSQPNVPNAMPVETRTAVFGGDTLRTIPSRQVRTAQPAQAAPQPAQNSFTPEQQYLIMKASETRARQSGSDFPPLPDPTAAPAIPTP
jgi:hypothetical protein